MTLNEQIKAIEMRIEATAQECSMASRLRTRPGFGVIGTTELSGEIKLLHRFDTEASLALNLGMTPLDHSSGLRHRGKRPKCVNSRCQAALMTSTVRHTSRVPESRTYYDRKCAQGKRHNRAVRALDRHLVRVIWRMLTEGRNYRARDE